MNPCTRQVAHDEDADAADAAVAEAADVAQHDERDERERQRERLALSPSGDQKTAGTASPRTP